MTFKLSYKMTNNGKNVKTTVQVCTKSFDDKCNTNY